MSSAPLSQKIALLLVGATTVALLLPYAGCNPQPLGSLESPGVESPHEEHSPSSHRADTSRDRSAPETEQAPLDQIEDLLSN